MAAIGLPVSTKWRTIDTACGPVPQVFRCPSAGKHEAVILLGLDFVEAEIRLHAIARLLGVGVEARLEVVDNREEDTLLEARDVDLPAFFFQPVLGVVDLLGFSSVPREQQRFSAWWIAPATMSPGATFASNAFSRYLNEFPAGFQQLWRLPMRSVARRSACVRPIT